VGGGGEEGGGEGGGKGEEGQRDRIANEKIEVGAAEDGEGGDRVRGYGED